MKKLELTIEKNLEVLRERIAAVDLIPGKSILVCDWDECLVTEHEAREITEMALELTNGVIDPRLAQDDFAGICYLMQKFTGLTTKQYGDLLLKAKAMPWRNGFQELIKKIISEKTFSLIIITSGHKYIPEMKLAPLGFPSSNTIGDEFCFESSFVCDPTFAVHRELKGDAVRMLRDRIEYPSPIIGLGHSTGDIPMLEACDVKISLGCGVDNADFYIHGAEGFECILEKFIVEEVKKMELKTFEDIFQLDLDQQGKIFGHFSSQGLVHLPLILSSLEPENGLRQKIIGLIPTDKQPTILAHEQKLRDNPPANAAIGIEACQTSILNFAQALFI